MSTAKILISMPEELALRMRSAIPARKRSNVLRKIIEREVERREQKLYDAALAVEKDLTLNAEMSDWDVTASDGVDDNETW